jgi:dTDP-4-amino-4,6-dideoxygalactose transaminase
VIPRVRPTYSAAELRAALHPAPDAVERFESELARHFGVRHALVFPYGRSALSAALRALDLKGEVVQPAYNCVVVAHATVLAGCRPVFADVESGSPNQDRQAMIDHVSASTVAVLPTSTFGVTFDAAALCEAIRRRNSRALILMDCCLCFDARWKDRLLAHEGDAAILAFGIGKPMTTLYGGALVTNSDSIASAVRRYRAAHYRARSATRTLARIAYFVASGVALSGTVAGLTYVLEHADTPLRRYLMRLRSREAIALPEDNEVAMTAVEASVGRVQLQRVSGFIHRRQAIGGLYGRALADLPGLHLLEWPAGSTYAIYAARLERPQRRAQILDAMRRGGVQGDTSLSYVVPELECYRAAGYGDGAFPNAAAWAAEVINLPNHPSLDDDDVERVVRVLRRAMEDDHA